ncbi:C6 transcription factor [Aspergillus udagawae]|uniref:C6 transcription factor n=1 Tax=Aspergillus udagawae TaxID=91492 RepID=A0ABQ1BEX0_9EURO|nr:C6 transcription factor [Aspergillus udagawae]
MDTIRALGVKVRWMDQNEAMSELEEAAAKLAMFTHRYNLEYGRNCAYERQPKSRGRPPVKSTNKNVRESPPSQPSNSVRTATSPRLVSPQRDSHWDTLETFPIAADNLGTMTFEPAGITVSLAGSSLPSGASMGPVSQSDIAFGVEMGNAMGIRSYGDAAALSQSFHNTLGLLEFHSARPTASRTEAGGGDAGLSPGLARADSVSKSWDSTASTKESFIGCPYTVLQPILPYICNMIPPDVACEMLDYFFNDPGAAVFQTRSPYNLATIFRRSSVLRMKEPRSTSSALLAAIFFVCAQTYDEKTFQNRSHVRARVFDELLAITVNLLGDAAPTTHSGTPACPSLSQARLTEDCEEIESWLTLDNVIACILCGIALSGSDNKFNCLTWFDRARTMALKLELNREQTQPSAQQEAFTYSELVAQEERKEERRRTWWLLYAMDRHLALCYNAPLHLLDSKCQVFQPLGDEEWQHLDVHLAAAQSPQRPFGPPSRVSGLGFFQFFLPYMVILGDVVSLHHFRLNSRDSVACLSGNTDISHGRSHPPKLFEGDGSINTTQIVATYGAFLVHTLAILTFGDWDIITMLQNGSPTLHGDNVTKFSHHTILASQAMESILDCDPELTYMPYLLGIYILQVGFAVLAVAENIGSQASSELREAIETFIRAHESCIATLDTKYQRNFRKVLIGTLSIMKGMTGCRLAEHQARRHEILSMYRWDDDGNGLLLT